MRIVSTYLPPEKLPSGQQAVLAAFDTLVDDKNLVVGITVGVVGGPTLDDVKCSAIGIEIIDRCARHHQLNYPDGCVVVAGVAQVASAPQRVRKVLAQAPKGAFVLLVCASDKVYDAGFSALGVDLQTLGEQSRH